MDKNCVQDAGDADYGRCDDSSSYKEQAYSGGPSASKRRRLDSSLEVTVTETEAISSAVVPAASSIKLLLPLQSSSSSSSASPPATVNAMQPVKGKTRLASDGRVTNELFESLDVKALKHVRKVLGRDSLMFNQDKVRYEKIVQENILYFWSEIITTKHYQQASLAYPFHFHCAVMLVELQQGFTHAFFEESAQQMREVHIIERDPNVCEYAPPLKQLLTKIHTEGQGRPLTHRGYLRACKFFKECLQEVLDRPNAIHLIMKRENTPLTPC